MAKTKANSRAKAVAAHRRRTRSRGLVRVELQVPAIDVGLVREIATVLRGEVPEAKTARDRMREVIVSSRPRSALDLFGSDLPDEYFEGVFDQDRSEFPRDIDL